MGTEEIDLAEELTNSRIIHLQLISKSESEEIKKILNLDKNFNFDMLMFMKEYGDNS